MGSITRMLDWSALPDTWSKWSRLTSGSYWHSWAAGWLGEVHYRGWSRSRCEAFWAFWIELGRALYRYVTTARIWKAA